MNEFNLPEINVKKYKLKMDLMLAYWLAANIANAINNCISDIHSVAIDAELYNKLAKKINNNTGKQTINIELKLPHIFRMQGYVSYINTDDPYIKINQVQLINELHKLISDEVHTYQQQTQRHVNF